MQIYRTRSEAVIEATPAEREEMRSRLQQARPGDRICVKAGSHERRWEHWRAAKTLTICIAGGRGFNAHWVGDEHLRVDVGEGRLAEFVAAFDFPEGAHCHYDPVAFPEEANEQSVELVIQDERNAT